MRILLDVLEDYQYSIRSYSGTNTERVLSRKARLALGWINTDEILVNVRFRFCIEVSSKAAEATKSHGHHKVPTYYLLFSTKVIKFATAVFSTLYSA